MKSLRCLKYISKKMSFCDVFTVSCDFRRVTEIFNKIDVGPLENSRSQMFFKIGVLKHFTIFTRKHLCWKYFLRKFKACRPAILSKRDSNTNVFSECCEIFKNTYFQEHCERLLLYF